MAEPLKTKGMRELGALLRRVERQQELGRISTNDAAVLTSQLRSVEARIIHMAELDGQGKEVSADG